MKDKELKDMTLNELLESDLSLDDIDEVIEEQLESERKKCHNAINVVMKITTKMNKITIYFVILNMKLFVCLVITKKSNHKRTKGNNDTS